MDFSGFNIWEILVAPLATFLIGFFWYGRPLFGRAWQRLTGLTDEEIASSNMLIIFGVSYLMNFIIAFFLSLFVEIAMMVGSNAIMAGLFSVLICLGLVCTSFAVNYLFARKPMKLFLIDAGYLAVSFFAMGLIIGAWY